MQAAISVTHSHCMWGLFRPLAGHTQRRHLKCLSCLFVTRLIITRPSSCTLVIIRPFLFQYGTVKGLYSVVMALKEYPLSSIVMSALLVPTNSESTDLKAHPTQQPITATHLGRAFQAVVRLALRFTIVGAVAIAVVAMAVMSHHDCRNSYCEYT